MRTNLFEQHASKAMNLKLPTPQSQPHRESIDSILAKNLVVARIVSGLTQHELANLAYVSRATIAQLETGYSDPRLSTIVELARGLGIPPILLLLGSEEIHALLKLTQDAASAAPSASPSDVARMRHLIETGLLKDRLRAARLGAAAATAGGATAPASVSAAIFSAVHPGAGTTLGANLGRLLATAISPRTAS